MKIYISLIFLFVLNTGCDKSKSEKDSRLAISTESNIIIPNVIKELSDLNYNPNNSHWTFDGQIFSGYAVSYFPNQTLKEKIGILEGKKHNASLKWYADGHLQRSAQYAGGKLDGSKKTWSPDSLHVLVSHLNYQRGKLHGIQTKWYPTGEIFKVLNLKNGKEEGMQKGYRKNGDLYANYEAREGRIFGLKKAALCYGLEDEKIQYAR